jgi:hypothetical protein
VNLGNLRHGQTCVDHLLDAPRTLRVAQVALVVVGDDQHTSNQPDRTTWLEVIAMGRGGIEPSTVLVSLRTADDLNEVTKEWAAVGTEELTLAAPWRTFRWCLGRHYGGVLVEHFARPCHL